jgi:hypothetical protein
MASPSHGVSFRGFSISEDSSRIQREAGWPCSPGTKLYEGGRWAGSPGSQRGWLCGSGPTKASLSYRWPPAGAEVAMAPGACHLMTVLALPDVPQTSGAPTKARPAGRPATEATPIPINQLQLSKQRAVRPSLGGRPSRQSL